MSTQPSEIENIFSLPSVSKAILEMEKHEPDGVNERQADLLSRIVVKLSDSDTREAMITRHTARRLDEHLKRFVEDKPKTVDGLADAYRSATDGIDVRAMADDHRRAIQSALERRDEATILKLCDDKGLLVEAARVLRDNKKDDFESWIIRTISSKDDTPLDRALKEVLPSLPRVDPATIA